MAFVFFLACFLLTYDAEGLSLNVQESATRRPESTGTLTTKVQKCITDYANDLNTLAPGLGETMKKRDFKKKAVSNRSIVIGAGQGTTATEALYAALRRLEMRVGHFVTGDSAWAPLAWMLQNQLIRDDCVNRSRHFDLTYVPEDVDAILDSPVPHLIIDYLLSFPRAKVLLTTRPAKEWAAARIEWMELVSQDPLYFTLPDEPFPIQEPCLRWQDLPDLTGSVSKLAHMYVLHNNLVRCIVPRDQLFEVDVFTKSTDGLMLGLANFLDRPPPANGTYPYCSGGFLGSNDDLCPMNFEKIIHDFE